MKNDSCRYIAKVQRDKKAAHDRAALIFGYKRVDPSLFISVSNTLRASKSDSI